MLIFLHRTYRGRTHKWWIQSAMIYILALTLCLFTYYFLDLYKHYKLLTVENKRLSPYIETSENNSAKNRQAPILYRLNFTYEYLQYLNQFEQFEKKARLAKWMRVYRSKNILYHQKNELELALNSDLLAPVMISLGNKLANFSQNWEKASPTEKNQMRLNFKQSLLTYEMVTKHHGYKILSSDWMRQIIIQNWYAFMCSQMAERNHQFSSQLVNYEELYPKLERLVEFYFQLPHVSNTWIKRDSVLLEKTKSQLNLSNDTDTFIS